jgi:hypothetical protein
MPGKKPEKREARTSRVALRTTPERHRELLVLAEALGDDLNGLLNRILDEAVPRWWVEARARGERDMPPGFAAGWKDGQTVLISNLTRVLQDMSKKPQPPTQSFEGFVRELQMVIYKIGRPPAWGMVDPYSQFKNPHPLTREEAEKDIAAAAEARHQQDRGRKKKPPGSNP